MLDAGHARTVVDPTNGGGRQQHQRLTYRADIDGLRAIAVVLVVLYHAGVPWFGGGYVGVDVFFVISGFLITSGLVAQCESGRLDLIAFYAGRARRLLPLATLTVVVTVFFGLWLLPVSRSDELLGDARSGLIYLSNWRFADKSVAYVDTAVSDGMLTHFWSLSIEEQFYLGWPLLVAGAALIATRVPRATIRVVVGVLAAAVVMLSLWASVHFTPIEGARAYYLTHLRLWEIAAGAVLAVVPSGIWRWAAIGDLVRVLSIGAIVWAAIAYGDGTPFPGSAATVPVVATVILLGLGGRDRVADRALGSPPLRSLGEHSYALYLVHWPTLGVFSLLASRLGWGVPTWAVVMLAIVTSWFLAVWSHRLVENPVRFAPRLQRAHRPVLLVGAATTVVLALAIGPLRTANLSEAASDWSNEPVSPTEAAQDKVSALYRQCHQTIASDFEPFEWCELGDPDGIVTIALAGDSHAQHWAPAFDVAGAESGWRVVLATRSSCLPYDIPLYSERVEKVDLGCREWGQAVRRGVADQDVDLFVVGRSFPYLESVIDVDGAAVDIAVASRMMSVAVSEFAAEIGAFADRLIILEDTPTAPFAIPDCLDGTGPDLAIQCDFTAQVDDLEHQLIAAEQAGLRSAPLRSARTVSLNDAVCPDGVCNALLADGTITLRDRAHLTARYSRSLGDAVQAAVRTAMDGSESNG